MSPGSTAFVANLAHAYALLGMQDEAAKILVDLTNRPGGSSGPETALAYQGLGEKDQAMAWLEKTYKEPLAHGS